MLENKMELWLQENVQDSPYLTAQSAKLKRDIREFQERAAKFHMERQTYTFTNRNVKETATL